MGQFKLSILLTEIGGISLGSYAWYKIVELHGLLVLEMSAVSFINHVIIHFIFRRDCECRTSVIYLVTCHVSIASAWMMMVGPDDNAADVVAAVAFVMLSNHYGMLCWC